MTHDDAMRYLTEKHPGADIKYIGSGTDSTAFRVDGRVFRFPHNTTDIYDKEAAVCDLIRERVSVPVPRIEIIHDGDVFCVAHEMIQGGKWSWHKFMWQPARQRRLADSCARFLAELHSIDATTAMRTVPALREQIPFCDFSDVADYFKRFMSPRQMRVFQKNYERIIGAAVPSCDMRLVHMGLKGPNSVVGADGVLCGVFDFGSCGIYERWRDLELFYLAKNAALYRRVRKTYARLSGRLIPRGRIEDLAVIEFLWRKRLYPKGQFEPRNDHFMMKNIAAALTRFYGLPRCFYWFVYMGLSMRCRRTGKRA